MPPTPPAAPIGPEDGLLRELREVSAGLLYPSESDEPFDAFVWKATKPDALKQLAAQGKKTAPLSETSVNDFFVEMIAGEDGEKYRNMRGVLESRLAGLRVLRLGEIEVDVYLIGKTSAGNWAGLHTVSVET